MTKPDGELTRLRDLEAAPGTTEADVAALVRAGAGGAPRAGSKARVRAALLARRTPSRAAWLRPVVVSLLLLAAAGARASRGPGLGQTLRRLVAWVAPTAVAPPTRTPESPPPAARSPEPPSAALEPAPVPLEPAPVAPEPAPVALEPAPVAPGPPVVATEVHATPRPVRHAAHFAPVTGDEDDPTIVAAAVRALRRDHDVARASALLDEYLRRWPRGALAEEAMALSIEAAQASGGAARSRTLAVRYLQRFPNGRFVETAHRALVPAPTP